MTQTLVPDGRIERRLWDAGFERVAGVDETGRGALAGPLFTCAVTLPPGFTLEGLTDSKLLTKNDREDLAAKVREMALSIAIVRVTPGSIDKRGLHRSNLKALRGAAMRLTPLPDYLIVDGYPVARAPFPSLAMRKGDRVSIAVAAASVIAKVERDRVMQTLDKRYPGYGFASNKGYGSADHWSALRKLGPCPEHRLSFSGVGQMSLWEDA